MGLITAGSNVTYVDAKNGALWVWNKETKTSDKFWAIEGRIVKIYLYEDKFKEEKTMKVIVQLVDEDNKLFSLKWTLESWYTQGFFSRIMNISLSKPVVIGASGTDKNEKVTFCWMKQNDAKVEPTEGFPKPLKVEKRGKAITNYDDMLDEVDKLLVKLQEALQMETPQAENKKKSALITEPEEDEIPF